VKLLDFGIAKLFGSTAVTTGSVMGTADFMAPEQAEGKVVGPRSDLYSLGSVMYALLTGRAPFIGKSVPEVVHKVRFESPIPVSRLANDVPAELEQLIEQLLEKNPQLRVPTAIAASHRLRAMEHALSIRPFSGSPDEIDTSIAPEPLPEATRQQISNQPTVRLAPQGHDPQAMDRVIVTTREGTVESGPDHFVAVEAGPARSATGFPWSTVGRVAALIGLIVLAIVGTQYLTRGPSADELYTQIVEQRVDGDPRSLVPVEREMERFLERFPDDPRGAEVTSLVESLNLHRRQRQLEQKAQRSGTPATPIEQLYLQLVRETHHSPSQSLGRFQAFLDLYSDESKLEEDQRIYLQLARARVQQLRAAGLQEIEAQQKLIDDRLQHARTLTAQNPAQAARIYNGIILLFESQPWASRSVQQARESLQQLSDTASGNPKANSHVNPGGAQLPPETPETETASQ
jgi:serine/threonine-protein kinase